MNDFILLRRELQQVVPYPQIYSHIDTLLTVYSPESFQVAFMEDVTPFRIDLGVLRRIASFLLGRFDRIYGGGKYALNDDFVGYLAVASGSSEGVWGDKCEKYFEGDKYEKYFEGGKCERYFEISSPDISIKILSSESLISEGTTGYSLWEASVALLALLSSDPTRFDDIFRDKRVLELGSGTGLGGLSIAALSKPKSVLLTDIPQVHDSFTRHNLLLNPSIPHITSDILHWNDLLPSNDHKNEEFETIVGCDIVYDPEICSLLISVFKNLFLTSSVLESVLLICTLRNPDTFDCFVKELKENLRDNCVLNISCLNTSDFSNDEIVLRSIESFRVIKINRI